MATLKYEIKYENGKTETVTVKPRHLIALEDSMGGKMSTNENNMTSKDAFKLPFIASKNVRNFAESEYLDWLDEVAEIETFGEEAEATAGAPSVDGKASDGGFG